jgi:hypothetical protein
MLFNCVGSVGIILKAEIKTFSLKALEHDIAKSQNY